MRGLTLPGDGDAPLNVLAVGAHADDIEIGAGGLLLELAAARPGLEVTWVVLSGDDERSGEARRSAAGLLGDGARLSIELYDHRERYFAEKRANFPPDIEREPGKSYVFRV